MRYVSEATGAVPKLREVSGGYLILGEDERTARSPLAEKSERRK
jgi:hypothetical protein